MPLFSDIIYHHDFSFKYIWLFRFIKPYNLTLYVEEGMVLKNWVYVQIINQLLYRAMKYGKSKTAFILLISLIYQRLTSELHFCSGSRSLATYE